MGPLEQYIRDLAEIKSSGAGVDETSYYPALSNFLNSIGGELKPRVRCVLQLQNRGAGNPDGGLFTAEQFKKSKGDPLPGQLPKRGAIEAKPVSKDVHSIAASDQVAKYVKKYGTVLVTNFREFLLVERDRDGKPRKLEGYALARGEKDFWNAAKHPRTMETKHGERIADYLRRVMQHAAKIDSPQDLAWFLASYAREALARINGKRFPALDSVRKAFQEALGVSFEGPKGDHFFHSTLVQTLFYGMFSAWVLWCRGAAGRTAKTPFNWHETGWLLRVPMIKALFMDVARPQRLEGPGLDEVLDWAAGALNRVEREAFFEKFEEEHAVQYFYEPFLEAFDPDLRKELGVWYTPPEIVKYMVARVDTVLREELGIADGLADPRVHVLDPCCGTGAYLVETLNVIAATLREKGGDALVAQDIKKAATERVFGFEILPAPFVVSHLQLGLLLHRLGAPLSGKGDERAGVYLTNALTGWEPPTGPKLSFTSPELEEEREAADRVKRDTPILVILGNPPYNAFAGVSPKEEKGLVEPYKEGLISDWGIRKFNLDELYVRFFRLAERRIAEMTGKGIVCFISNYSWLSDPSFVVLRKRLLLSFDRFWIENMHGDRKISEYAPDGATSETVFAIPGFSPGIRQGVAISLWVKRDSKAEGARVGFRDDVDAARAIDRRAQLLASLRAQDFNGKYKEARPDPSNRFSFRPQKVTKRYLSWPRIVDLCAVPPTNGLMEKRGGALIDIDRKALEERMRAYFDLGIDWDELKAQGCGLTRRRAAYNPKETRRKAAAAERFERKRVVRYAVRPFDMRWCYYTAVMPVWNRPRPSLWAQCWEGNAFLLTRFNAAKSPEGPPFYFTGCLCDDHLLAPDAVAIPCRLKNGTRLDRKDQTSLFDLLGEGAAAEAPVANISKGAREYLAGLGLADPDSDAGIAGLLWMHALATGYSSAYLAENADGVRQDWPRVPLPATRKRLEASASLGLEVAGLLDSETGVKGVTEGRIRKELKALAVVTGVGVKSLDPRKGHLDLTAGWGHEGKDGATMPGRGDARERDYTKKEKDAVKVGAKALRLSQGAAFACLGETTFDVYLNGTAYWSNVPANVWQYTIGGYQVIKKWLSYRERPLLGRGLTPEEARKVTNIARRIAAILLVGPALDDNYHKVKADTYAWPSKRQVKADEH